MSTDESGGDWDFVKRPSRPAPEPAPADEAPSAAEPVSEGRPTADDDWGFVKARTESPASSATPRARGEIREMRSGPSLKRRALPMALCLLFVSLAGFLTEIVASTQVLTLAGPSALLWIYPLGGLGLLAVALLQFRFVDHRARLPMIRIASLVYAVAFVVALVLVGSGVVPVVGVGVMWVLSDQLNFLLPLLIWSLAGDEFNAAEGRKIFGWIVSWTYAGQVLGLAISAASPTVLRGVDIPLWSLLAVVPVVCAAVAVYLPAAMRGSAAAKGAAREETWAESVKGAWDFVTDIPAWRSFFFGSLATFVAGMTLFMAFFAGADELAGTDDATLQTYVGGVSLVAFVLCWLLQVFAAERILTKLDVPGTLLLLPISSIASAVLLVAGLLYDSLALLAVGFVLWLIPRWSIDENARRGALTLVPDQRRARVSFLVDLLPVAVGLVASGPIAAFGILTGVFWYIPVAAGVAAVIALPLLLQMRRRWDDSLLDWRLRRRKQGRVDLQL